MDYCDKKFAVLMTCYNRVEKTMECLQHLFAAKIPERYAFDVWVNDDGSTDGTFEKVTDFFVMMKNKGWRGRGCVIHGSGMDYWCGGMRRVWAAASKHYRYDGYLWMNDDTFIFENAIVDMLGCKNQEKSIVVGATISPDGSEITYSGRDKIGNKIHPDGSYQHIWCMNGNCVWIPRYVHDRLGNFLPYFTHALGDFDYALRAIESGIDIFLSSQCVGKCSMNTKKPSWMNARINFYKRCQNLYSPRGGPEPLIFFKYNLSHFGFLRALRCIITQHLRLFVPAIKGSVL